MHKNRQRRDERLLLVWKGIYLDNRIQETPWLIFWEGAE